MTSNASLHIQGIKPVGYGENHPPWKKLACGQCLLEATADKQGSLDSIKNLIKDSIRELALSQDQLTPPMGESAVETLILLPDLEANSKDESNAAEEITSTFDFGLIKPIIIAVKDAIQWEEDPELPSKMEILSSPNKDIFKLPFNGGN